MDENASNATFAVNSAHSRPHLVFSFDAKLYALPVASIDAVVNPVPINAVPGGSRVLAGIMNLRGEALSILDARGLLGSEQPAGAAPAVDGEGVGHLIILTSEHGRFGLKIDKALKVVGLVPQPLSASELMANGQQSASSSYALFGGETILILTPDTLSARSST